MNNTPRELPYDIYDRVTELSEQGNNLLDRGDTKAAISAWRSALQLLPEPRRQWDAAVWLHASIGDAQRDDGDLNGALDSFPPSCGERRRLCQQLRPTRYRHLPL